MTITAGADAAVDGPHRFTLAGLGVWQRRGVAILAAVLLAAAFQPIGIWPFAPIGVATLTVAIWGTTGRRTFSLGYLFGLVFLAITIGWVSVIAVPVAVLLIAFEALWFGLLALLIVAMRRLRAWPVFAGAAWLIIEYLYSRVPFGGFGWVRLVFATADAPVSGLLPFVGSAGVSYVVALFGQLLAWTALTWSNRGWRATTIARRVTVSALMLGLILGLSARSYNPPPSSGTVAVGMVQGNVDGVGIEALGRQRSVTNNHLSETVTLMSKARAGQVPMPDFVLWPENSTDIDPAYDQETAAVIKTATQIAGVPILVGAVTYGPGPDHRQTTSIWWDPQQGPGATYHKRNLVPFGEWIPFRDQLLPLVPMLRLVGAQGVPGTGPGVLDVDVPGRGQTHVGVLICFELAYDETFREMLQGSSPGSGAQLVTVQSNNATYAGTGQIAQQFAITRIRAMEAHREVLVSTTNALSGYIRADGTPVYTTHERTAASTVVVMPLRTTITPGVRFGAGIELALVALGIGGLIAGTVVAARARHR